MTRTQLRVFDHGLYSALVRSDQLKLAIFETMPHHNRIRGTYRWCHGDLRSAAKKLDINMSRLAMLWQWYGLQSDEVKKKQTYRRSKAEIDKIKQAYQTFNGNCSLAAKTLQIPKSVVWYAWNKHGLREKVTNRGRPRVYIGERLKLILDLYDPCHGSSSVAAERLGIHRSTVYALWNRHGLIKIA